MFSRRTLVSITLRVSLRVWGQRWLLLSILLVITSVTSIIWPVPLWLNLLLVAAGIVLFVIDMRSYVKHRKEIVFLPRVDNGLERIEVALADLPRFELLRLAPGTFLIDHVFSEAVSTGTVTAILAREAYRRPPEFAELSDRFIRLPEYSRLAHYDGNVAGLDSDLGTGPAPATTRVCIVPARYSDHVATDLFAMRDVRIGAWNRTDLGRRLFIDRNDRLRDFGSSWLLHAIGTSVVAITTDGKIIAVQQSAINQSSGGLLAPTGSGSLEPCDFSGSVDVSFKELVAGGALREMGEESGITIEDVAEWDFLGFGRWVEKAGSPEAICVAFLKIDSHEAIRRRIPKQDAPFSLRKVSVAICLDEPVGSAEKPAVVVCDDFLRGQLSLPLLVGITMLARAYRNPASPLYDRLHHVVDRDDDPTR